MEELEEEYTQCPNCDANWGIEEISFQECDCCGYPDNDDEELREFPLDDDDDDDDFENAFDDDSIQDDAYDPNEAL